MLPCKALGGQLSQNLFSAIKNNEYLTNTILQLSFYDMHSKQLPSDGFFSFLAQNALATDRKKVDGYMLSLDIECN